MGDGDPKRVALWTLIFLLGKSEQERFLGSLRPQATLFHKYALPATVLLPIMASITASPHFLNTQRAFLW